MEIRAVLSKSDFFSGLTPRSLTDLSAISFTKTAAKDEILFSEGREGSALYVLAEGAVQLYKTTEDGKLVVIKTVLPGETFAEAILFEQDSYPVSAVALSKSRLLVVPKVQVECLLDNREFRNEFIGMLIRRVRYLAERIVSLTSHDVEERLFHFLEDRFGRRTEYSIDMSKKAVAAEIGTIPETFSRLLNRLGSDGILMWEGTRVTVDAEFWKTWDYA